MWSTVLTEEFELHLSVNKKPLTQGINFKVQHTLEEFKLRIVKSTLSQNNIPEKNRRDMLLWIASPALSFPTTKVKLASK